MQEKDKVGSRQTSLQLSGLLLILILFFHSTVTSLFSRWLKLDQSLSHGLPTAAIFIFLLWRISAQPGKRNSTSTHWFVSIVLGFLSVCWYLVEAINLELISAVLLLVIFTFYVASSFSLTTARQLLPLITIFVFTIPIWSELTDMLVQLSSFVVGHGVEVIGITAFIEGNNILIPSGIIQIAEGCSGLRYLTISLLLTYIVCLINGYNLRQSLLALTVGAFLGLLTNWVRIITLVIVGYKTNMQSSLMHDHETFGWILFAIIILPALYFAPLLEKHISFKINAPKFKPLIPTLFLVLGPIVLLVSERNADYSNHLSIERLKLTQSSVSNINLADIPFSDTILISKGTASVDTTEIKLTLAKSIAPPENKKLVPYIGNFFDASEWAVEDEKPMEVDGEKFTLLTLKRVNSSHTSLLMYQFNVGKNNTGSYRQAKLLQLKARLLGEDFFGLFVMQASCKKECKDEVNALKETAKQWHQLKYYPKP